MPFPGGLWWLLCCRQGFTLLRRDYCEASKGVTSEEVEESFELRRQGDEDSTLQVNLTQPSRASSCSESWKAKKSMERILPGDPYISHSASELIGPSWQEVTITSYLLPRSLPVTEETYSLITENCGRMQHEPDAIVKGWLQREVRGGIKKPWLRPRKYWFVLTEDSLDYYSGCEVTAQRLGSLVLTSLCSVLWPDKQTYKETGYWAVTVFGRKHCYRLYTEHLNEAVHWVCALQKVIISKAPLQTPTQLLMHDIEENHNNPEILDQIYRNNPILRYTAGPIYAPLLPFPYAAQGGQGYAGLRDEAVKLFHSLQQLEELRDPILLMQGVLQTCHDLPALVDEIFCQLVKQTTEPPIPGAPTDLRYWQLLVCMSYTFIPSVPILCYLHLHLQRMFDTVTFAALSTFLLDITSLFVIPHFVALSQMSQELMLHLGVTYIPNSLIFHMENWQHKQPCSKNVLNSFIRIFFVRALSVGLWIFFGQTIRREARTSTQWYPEGYFSDMCHHEQSEEMKYGTTEGHGSHSEQVWKVISSVLSRVLSDEDNSAASTDKHVQHQELPIIT